MGIQSDWNNNRRGDNQADGNAGSSGNNKPHIKIAGQAQGGNNQIRNVQLGNKAAAIPSGRVSGGKASVSITPKFGNNSGAGASIVPKITPAGGMPRITPAGGAPAIIQNRGNQNQGNQNWGNRRHGKKW